MTEGISVFDCDGHIIESIRKMAEYMEPAIRDVRASVFMHVTRHPRWT